MPTKPRRAKLDPKIVKELEDFERRMRETDRRVDALLARSREVQKKLRELARR